MKTKAMKRLSKIDKYCKREASLLNTYDNAIISKNIFA